jgi:hypothetical protein
MEGTKGISMRKLYIAAFAYLLVGVASGLYYRELTKLTGWPEGAPTQLGVVHTHLLTLGFIVLLIVMVVEKVFELSRSRLFSWFFWIYNAGVILTAGMLTLHGSMTVLGAESSKAIAGIAGTGHILLTAGLILLMLALRKPVFASLASRASATAEDSPQVPVA